MNCRLGHIEEYAQSYFSTGNIHASDDVRCYAEVFSLWMKENIVPCFDIPDLFAIICSRRRDKTRRKTRLRIICLENLFPFYRLQVCLFILILKHVFYNLRGLIVYDLICLRIWFIMDQDLMEDIFGLLF